MSTHIALYKFRPEITKSHIEKTLSKVTALVDKIPGIIEISTAENTSKYSEGYTHVILIRGENQEAIDAYRSHPDHQVVARELDAMEERGVGVDFETNVRH